MLTAKQQRFVDEYSVDRNASRAARAAGYSPTSAKVTACRLLTKANVLAAVTEREISARQTLNVTREGVLVALQEAVELSKAQHNPMAMIAGWREIAKICGYYAPERHQVALSADAAGEWARIEAMSDEELLQIMAVELTVST